MSKFNNQININEDKILKKIKNDKLNSKEIIEYNLSEISFNANNKTELENKTSEIEKFFKEMGLAQQQTNLVYQIQAKQRWSYWLK